MKKQRKLSFLPLLLCLLVLIGGCSPVDDTGASAPPSAPQTTAPPIITAPTTEPPTEPPDETEPPPPEVLIQFEPWVERNGDMVGWITLPKTKIDYPVVQSGDNEYYLKHDIDNNYHEDGSVFLTFEADILERNTSLALFGHHRNNGLMFSDLHKYKKLDFYKESPTFSFDTLYEEGDYKIFAVFYMAQNSDDEYFYYYPKPSFKTDEAFLHHIDQMKTRSIFNLPVDVEPGDQVVILTCCSYETKRLSIAVAGRKVREGESLDVDVDLAEKNPNPLYPKKWYDKYGGTPPPAEWIK